MTTPSRDTAGAARLPPAGAGSAGASDATLARRHGRTWPDDAGETELPNCARVHDAVFGGAYNFGADRAFAAHLTAAVPDLTQDLYAERHFLLRAVRLCAQQGVTQFIDLGCGMPTVGNARAVVRQAAPDARVLCVDLDPLVVDVCATVMHDDARAAVVQADIRRPDDVLDHDTTQALLNLDQPVVVLAIGVLHLLDQPQPIIGRLLERLPAGSVLVASHLTADSCPDDVAALVDLAPAAGPCWVPRSRAEVTDLFTGIALARPGVVYASRWRPAPDDDVELRRGTVLAGVGRRPTHWPTPGRGTGP